jgi:hypothetical protein
VSLIPAGLSVLAASIDNLINPVLFVQRNIGGFVADVTVREHHIDELAMTDHPVEQGANVSDHSYKRPATVTIEAAWSNSSFQSGGDPNYTNAIYDQFLSMQADRTTFNIVTGKRQYQNMLAARVSVVTDEKTEQALFMTVECKEILIAQTQIVTVNSSNMQNQQQAPPTQDGASSTGAPPTGTQIQIPVGSNNGLQSGSFSVPSS